MRILAAVLALGFLFLQPATSPAKSQPIVVAAAQIQFFNTEAAAQKHCPNDEVVWLNIPSGIYHLKGERWYGRTKNGAYVCRREADAADDRDEKRETDSKL